MVGAQWVARLATHARETTRPMGKTSKDCNQVRIVETGSTETILP